MVEAARNDFGLSVHAIGDHANRVVLDAFQNLRESSNSLANGHLRHRIEHLQLLHPDDVKRPSELKIISSMQPIHATSDMLMADRYWGRDRLRYGYAWRSVIDSGGPLIFGSDAPIESPNPFLGLHAAITRRRIDGSPGEDGWIPEEKISLLQALHAYTTGPAYAAGLENLLGCLSPNFLADLVVLDQDPFQSPPDQLHNFLPVGTMVGGDWKFRSF
jgi:predicted amidohydrolase YtcJ